MCGFFGSSFLSHGLDWPSCLPQEYLVPLPLGPFPQLASFFTAVLPSSHVLLGQLLSLHCL